MLLLDQSPANIWRMLLPKNKILFPCSGYDELIFYYRNHVYFVHEDGAVVRMNKPGRLHKLKQEDLWEILFHEKDTFDYDDHGIFSIGGILLHMGFMVPLKTSPYHSSYRVEIVQMGDRQHQVIRYELHRVSFQYALYHAHVYCHEWNEKSCDESEHAVQQISRIDDAFQTLDQPFFP